MDSMIIISVPPPSQSQCLGIQTVTFTTALTSPKERAQEANLGPGHGQQIHRAQADTSMHVIYHRY